MRYAAISFALWLVLCAAPTLRAAPINDLPAVIVTRQTVFSIPFTVPSINVADQPTEVRLLASADRGSTWQITDRVDLRAQRMPYKGGFVFRAPRDGEYWFAIRTVDRQGQMRSERIGGPELRVMVDTRPPRLDLSPTGGSTASINRSRASNNNRPAEESSQGAASGGALGFSQSTQWPADARTDLPLGRGTPARGQTTGRGVDGRSVLPNRAPVDDVGPIEGPALSPPVDGRVRPSGQPLDRDVPSPGQQYLDNGPSAPVSRIHPPVGNQYIRSADEARAPNTDVRSPTFFDRGGAGTITASEVSSPRMARAGSFDYVIPPGEQLRMVNSTAFELDYDVESVGRSGIAKVELWVTRDGGRTWNSIGVDSDNRSPFRTVADGEGVYGYRMTVQSGSGLGGRPPQAGDLPEVWIGVDLTRPAAGLISAEPGTGERAGEMIIRYEANDALLSKGPITLLRSAQPGGPWTTIAAGLDNSGQYSWRFDSTAPDRVYLRLEVRDEAGNIGTFEAADPISLERVLPQGRLRNVRPVGDSAGLTAPNRG